MSLGSLESFDRFPSKASTTRWNHGYSCGDVLSHSETHLWKNITDPRAFIRARIQLLPDPFSPKTKRGFPPSLGRGFLGGGSGDRFPVGKLPVGCGKFSEKLPVRKARNRNKSKELRILRWQREHMLLTLKHLPDRVPLPDKGKPVARQGRKAADLSVRLPGCRMSQETQPGEGPCSI